MRICRSGTPRAIRRAPSAARSNPRIGSGVGRSLSSAVARSAERIGMVMAQGSPDSTRLKPSYHDGDRESQGSWQRLTLSPCRVPLSSGDDVVVRVVAALNEEMRRIAGHFAEVNDRIFVVAGVIAFEPHHDDAHVVFVVARE